MKKGILGGGGGGERAHFCKAERNLKDDKHDRNNHGHSKNKQTKAVVIHNLLCMALK